VDDGFTDLREERIDQTGDEKLDCSGIGHFSKLIKQAKPLMRKSKEEHGLGEDK